MTDRERVREIQRILLERGHGIGAPDGAIGPLTLAAILAELKRDRTLAAPEEEVFEVRVRRK